MGLDTTARMAFAMQIGFADFVRQISIANVSKIIEIIDHGYIEMHSSKPTKLYDSHWVGVDVEEEKKKLTKSELVEVLKRKLEEELEYKNDILIFSDKLRGLDVFSRDYGKFHDSVTLEDHDMERSLFRDFCEELGLTDYKIVLTVCVSLE